MPLPRIMAIRGANPRGARDWTISTASSTKSERDLVEEEEDEEEDFRGIVLFSDV